MMGVRILVSFAAAGLLLGACTRPEPAAGPYGGENAADADQLWVPTQAEVDDTAADEIDESNADAELARLERELEQED